MLQSTWILIADGAKATFYQYEGANRPLNALKSLTHINEQSQDLTSTKRGRMRDPGQGQRSAFARPTDPHEHEKTVFAKELADYADEHATHYDRLIIVASPNVLGDLRQFFSSQVESKVTDELAKDLTNIPATELPGHLQDILNIEENPGGHLSPKVAYAKP